MKYKDAHIRFRGKLAENLTKYVSENGIVLNQYVVIAVQKQLQKDLARQHNLSTTSTK